MLLLQCYFLNVTSSMLLLQLHLFNFTSLYVPASCFRSLGCSSLGWRGRFFLELPRLVSMRPHRVSAIGVVVHIGIYRVSFFWLMLPMRRYRVSALWGALLGLAWSILFSAASLSFDAPASCFSYQGGRAHRYLSCFLLLAYAPDAQVSCFSSLGCSTGVGVVDSFFSCLA